jgi:hypothetical protein
MHKALRCTCSQNPPLLSPSFLISFDINITQSLLLDLCLCNPLSLLLGVECNSFCSSVHLFTCITPQIISLSISSLVHHSWLLLFGWWICGAWICCCLILPTFLLPLVPSSSFPLLSFSCLLFVADCHVNFPPFLLHSHFVDWSLSDKLTYPLFRCTLRVPPLGSMGACSWSLNECDSCCCQVISRENFQLAQRHCCHSKG